VFGQSIADIQTPKLIPPSPDAAALGKYAQIPVDKSTGVPNISVPLYAIKTPRFSLPISLSYHASGIRVDETASWVGIGWSLNCGGVITRNISGLPDDAAGAGYLNSSAPPSVTSIYSNFHADSAYLENVAQNLQDSQPDNYFYNFANQSGAFTFGEDKKPIIIPYKPLSITFNATTPRSFTILDEQGDSYWFNDRELSTSNTNFNMTGTSSWYLTQMVSADKSDTVKFTYTQDPTQFIDNTFSFTQNLGDFTVGGGGGLWPMEHTTNTSNVQQIHLTSIVYNGGRVDFKTKTGRSDLGKVLLDSIIVSNYDFNLKKYNPLKSIKLLTDYTYSTLLNQTGFNTDEASKYRLILTGVSENDQNNSAVKTHLFEYNSTMLPPVHNFGQDKWGYYNGVYTNQSLLEAKQVVSYVPPNAAPGVYTIGSGQGADRSVSSTYMQAGILQKITYPTKGYTTFNYECNQYSTAAISTIMVAAGSGGYYHDTDTAHFTPLVTGLVAFHVHIKSTGSLYTTSSSYVTLTQGATTLYSSNASATADIDLNVAINLTAGTTYVLTAVSIGGNASTPSGSLPQASIVTSYQLLGADVATNVGGLRVKSIKNYDNNGAVISTETYKYGDYLYGAESGMGKFLTNSSLMVNHSVHLYNYPSSGAPGSSTGLIETYSNSSVYPLSSLSGSPVAYEQVSVYHGDTVQNIGKSIYQYTVTADSIKTYSDNQVSVPLIVGYNSSTHQYQYFTHTENYNPSQGIKPIPTLWKNGEPTLETHYRNNGSGQYLPVQSKSTAYNLFYRGAGRGLFVQYILEPPTDFGSFTNINAFMIYDYPISAGSRLPSQTITTNYASDGITKLVQDTVNYYYDNSNHMLPTRIQSYDGKGNTLLKQVKYPQDMVTAALDPTGIYAAMVTANIVSPVVQFTDLKNSTQLMQSVTNYASTGGKINPSTVTMKVMANAAETRLNYQLYDSNNGNLLTVSQQSGPPISYIWGYGGQYPVAEAKNALAKNIFYESFEDGNGNSTGGNAKSGYYSHTGTYSKTLSGLDNGAYLLTYWQNTGSAWSFVSSPVTVSGGSYTISISTQVDDIRFYPASAQMTTYTYNPGVGVTSATDAKNQITLYEYDQFERLLNIKDKDGNIVKSFCYNYAGQATGCSVNPLPPPPANTYSFTLTNSTGVAGFNAYFTGSAGSFNFSFLTSGSKTVQLPAGSYSVTVNPVNAPTNRKFLLGTRSPVTAPGTTFTGVTVGSTGTETPLIIQNP